MQCDCYRVIIFENIIHSTRVSHGIHPGRERERERVLLQGVQALEDGGGGGLYLKSAAMASKKKPKRMHKQCQYAREHRIAHRRRIHRVAHVERSYPFPYALTKREKKDWKPSRSVRSPLAGGAFRDAWACPW